MTSHGLSRPHRLLLILAALTALLVASPVIFNGLERVGSRRFAARYEPFDRFDRLVDQVERSAEGGLEETAAARSAAEELLGRSKRFRRDYRFMNGIHYSHIVLGRLALANGDFPTATRHLEQAGRTPVTSATAPNTILAREVLALGGRDIVIRYLDDYLANSHTGRRQEATRWREDLRSGRQPHW
jgi:hypothetical protein